MADLNRGERLQIMLTQDELEALDNWRFERRMPSRAAAIRELLKRGLVADGFDTADGKTKSREFGVIPGSDGAGPDEPSAASG
ncbi:MAG: ribbon-helix-helix protein, CopG family [Bradyrhizobium sp.]